jgi:type I restriction enzyme S subunit
MSFPRYENYKDSGVEWLGEVPEHWKVTPFYSVASEREEPNIGMKENNLLSLSYGRIVRKDICTNDGLLPESFETYQIVRRGDIIFRLTDLQNDKRSLRTAIVEDKKGIITSAYLATAPVGIAHMYLSYLIRTCDIVKVFSDCTGLWGGPNSLQGSGNQ